MNRKTQDQKKIMEILRMGPCSIKSLAIILELSEHRIRNLLTEPLFKGDIEECTGTFYQLKNEGLDE